MVCMDDKAVVPVGDPGMPLSTSVNVEKRKHSCASCMAECGCNLRLGVISSCSCNLRL